MNIRLICYESTQSWILGKLTNCLADELRRQGETVEIGQMPDPAADINHHIIYLGYDGKPSSLDTMMITHIDTADKVAQLRHLLAVAGMGICLSADTMHKLSALGLPRRKLSFINFPSPQQGNIQVHKISIGITSRCYLHGSKREYLLGQLAQHLPRNSFIFHIMGHGWDAVIHELRRHGSEVVYHGDFDPNVYRQLWQLLDYYLYLGQDEGSTGFLDAMEAGVPAIATPQGFHLDLPIGLSYAFNDFEDLRQIFNELYEERNSRRNAIGGLTWPGFALKHLVVWREAINRRTGRNLYNITPEELASVGICADSDVTGCMVNPWLGQMPTSPGPGGAVHRLRLLLVADEPLEQLDSIWRTIINSAPQELPIILNCAGREVEQRKYLKDHGMEIKLLDYRSCSNEEIVLLSFDFDAVGFWNMAPLNLVKRLQKRSNKSYSLCHKRLFDLCQRLQTTRLSLRWMQTILFRLIHSLKTRSSVTTVLFWSHPVRVGQSNKINNRDLSQCLSIVDLAVFTDNEWGTLFRTPANHARFESMDLTTFSRSSWQNVFHRLFQAVRAQPANVEPCGWLRVIKRFVSWARQFKMLITLKRHY